MWEEKKKNREQQQQKSDTHFSGFTFTGKLCFFVVLWTEKYSPSADQAHNQ